ncbi:MAG: CDP-diacylglycerol--serine O-phosphatidyltransferase [Bradymonadales bacterium]|nr:CDP-diacylglycerol--serine O-phosphatidyltransferase [Bradymonadales bacterium]
MIPRRRISLRKSLFILPNLFTLGATFCGFYSMLLAGHATRPWDFWAAGWLIGFAAIFDGVDGRVARLTRTQSAFGLQLDSLSDTVAFGIAPAWLVYHWGLSGLGPVGFLVAFVFAAATSIRLARFNVIAQEGPDPRFFVGLPSPLGAVLIAGPVTIHTSFLGQFRIDEPAQVPIVIGYTLFVAFLLVSNIRFRSFKRIPVNRLSLVMMALGVGMLVYLGIATRLEIGLYSVIVAYVAIHLAAVLIHLERRLTGRLHRPVALDEEEEDLLGLDEPIEEEEDGEEVVGNGF